MVGYGSDITAYNMETPGEEPEEFEDDSQDISEEQVPDRSFDNLTRPAPYDIEEPMKFVYEDGMLQECKNPKCHHFFHLVVIANNPKEKHEKK